MAKAEKNKIEENNGEQQPVDSVAPKPRVISNPRDIATLVMAQLNAVNAKKDELTIAIKGLMDTANQLVNAYAGHAQTIQQLMARVKDLEEKTKVEK